MVQIWQRGATFFSFEPRNVTGVANRQVIIRTNIECNRWAWNKLPAWRLFYRWAWTSSGLIALKEMTLANDMSDADMAKSLDQAERSPHAFNAR